jgi:hypothetical protein
VIEDKRDDWGTDGELGSLLDAYAADRLRPDPEAAGRARARVLAEVRRGAAPRSDRPSPAALPGRPRSGWRIFRAPAVVAALLLLAGLLAAGAVVAGSGPGGPFYGLRIWAEEMTLPADPAQRAAVELAHLETRLAEARDAAANGNGGAVTAALEAYRRTADAALEAAGDDPGRRERLALRLGLHVAVLEALVGEVPGRASEAIQDAVERSEEKVEEILSREPGKPVGPAGPEATPRPTPKPRPEATPKPTPPGKPEATPGRIEATPRPRPEATSRPTKSPPPNRPTPAP